MSSLPIRANGPARISPPDSSRGKAFRAGFHRMAHLVLPVPVGSRERVMRNASLCSALLPLSCAYWGETAGGGVEVAALTSERPVVRNTCAHCLRRLAACHDLAVIVGEPMGFAALPPVTTRQNSGVRAQVASLGAAAAARGSAPRRKDGQSSLPAGRPRRTRQVQELAKPPGEAGPEYHDHQRRRRVACQGSGRL